MYGCLLTCALLTTAPGDAIVPDVVRLDDAVPSATSVKVYEPVTLACKVTATYDNPFDSAQVALDALVTEAGGRSWTAPGYFTQDYTRELVDGGEKLTPAGEPRWQVKLSFPRPGVHTVRLRLRQGQLERYSPTMRIEVLKADAPGFVRVSQDDHRYFVTDRGETFFPVGANVCWASKAGTYDYDRWLPRYASAGANYWRAWLAPQWMTFSLNTPASGYDRIDLENAWQFEQTVLQSEQLGLRILACIDSFNIIRSKSRQHGIWEDTPYIKANGGPLAEPREYFTNPEMLRSFRERLRYLVARFGYSTAIFAWEFWNEVDIIDQYDSEAVTAWHQEMARHLRSIDPWQHMISTSTARPQGDPRLDALPELEFVQTHHYGAKDMAANLGADIVTKKAAEDRPHYHGEYGIGHSGTETRKTDPTGIHIHNGLFSCVGQQQAGTPMTWWWDSYIDPQNLYPIYASFVAWIDGFDFVAQHARPIEAEVTLDPSQPTVRVTEPILPNVATWEPHPVNQPVTVSIDAAGRIQGVEQLAKAVHGLKNHPDLHNPVTFEMDVPDDSEFGIRVDGVSGHGGAKLVVTVDGTKVIDEDFADNDQGTETLMQYNRVYPVPLRKGRHTVVVENTGNDWFYVAYILPWRTTIPALRVSGLLGETRALAWIQNQRATWSRMTTGEQPTAVEGAQLRLAVPAGKWQVEWFDTWAGEAITQQSLPVGDDGLTISLPPIATDLALKLVQEP